MKEQEQQGQGESRREFGKKMLGAAIGGLLAGAALTSRRVMADDAAEKHACKGMNSCKGKGGDGKNECKGKGSCATVKHDCKGHNECKAQGGCKSGDNGCAGKNSCKAKGGCSVPVNPEHLK